MAACFARHPVSTRGVFRQFLQLRPRTPPRLSPVMMVSFLSKRCPSLASQYGTQASPLLDLVEFFQLDMVLQVTHLDFLNFGFRQISDFGFQFYLLC
ncbi:hypothetical protein E2562_007867 [Oryza meyeriana var. granulata]|uniref:Uncharacterized protein n=1 Tax=Oryza meyeriana var. granulata TaxID=110450 RepID=A0A6G1F576_9ORYZ|nr:hypothetical protein E2562_007867 [Oryza meyeriana var. granulata]